MAKGGKRTIKAAVVEEPMAELLEAEVSEGSGSEQGEELLGAELAGNQSEGDDSCEDEDEEMTEESLRKVMEMLGPEALAQLEAEQEVAAGEEEGSEDEDDEDAGSDAEEQGELLGASESSDDEPEPSTKTDPVALDRVLKTFKLDTSFFDTQTVTYPESLDIPDAGDDLSREVQFYKQSLWAANEARQRFLAANKPFARPSDYYAEMVKTDAHMERIRQRLLDERASLEASEKAKAQRQLKKFGKQVQVAKLQERQQAKKALENKVKDFKNKKKRDANSMDDDQFGVELEEDERPTKKPRGIVIKRKGGKGQDGKAKMPRDARNAKYGHPSGGKRSKQNTKESSGDISGFNRGRKSQKAKQSQRPGKSKRAAKR